MDIGLPDRLESGGDPQAQGGETSRELVVVTLHEDRHDREEAVKAWATSYITKDHLVDELPCCIDHLAKLRPAAGGDHEPSGASAL